MLVNDTGSQVLRAAPAFSRAGSMSEVGGDVSNGLRLRLESSILSPGPLGFRNIGG